MPIEDGEGLTTWIPVDPSTVRKRLGRYREESPNAGPARMFAAVLVALILVGWCTMMWTTARAPVEQRDDLRHLLRTGGAAAADRVISSIYSLRRARVGHRIAADVFLELGDRFVSGVPHEDLWDLFHAPDWHGERWADLTDQLLAALRPEDMLEVEGKRPLGSRRVFMDTHELNSHGLDVLRVLRVAQELGGELPAATPGGSL